MKIIRIQQTLAGKGLVLRRPRSFPLYSKVNSLRIKCSESILLKTKDTEREKGRKRGEILYELV